MKKTAIINVYNGGKWGKMGQYKAIIIPKYFKNGNMCLSGFQVVKVLEIIKKGYKYPTATSREVISSIID